MTNIYRQGDVLLIQEECLPDDAVPERRRSTRIVLAYGEATGHAHAIDGQHASLYSAGGTRFIQTVAGANLTHEEHAAIKLEPGIYRVVQQREYTPAEVRYVRD